nr:hypothetical protein [Zobellella taiwanensis]
MELFQGLFRGRTDVHAVRWEKADGRAGYAVACSNEWVQGICLKPKIKCGDCPHRRFTPLDSQVLFAHLSGKLVAGLYPMQPDHHCHLLAMDFDKADWKADVKAIAHLPPEAAPLCTGDIPLRGRSPCVDIFLGTGAGMVCPGIGFQAARQGHGAAPRFIL